MPCATRGKEDEAALILNLLESVGLVGSKLAVSLGDEKVLTKQVTEKLGIPEQSWHYEFVRGQVRAATQLEDLEKRLQGGKASVSIQRLEDVIAAKKVVQEESSTVQDAGAIQLVVPKKGTLGKSVKLRSGRVVAEEEVEDKGR